MFIHVSYYVCQHIYLLNIRTGYWYLKKSVTINEPIRPSTISLSVCVRMAASALCNYDNMCALAALCLPELRSFGPLPAANKTS